MADFVHARAEDGTPRWSPGKVRYQFDDSYGISTAELAHI